MFFLGTINVGAGRTENNASATRSRLDLATKTTHDNTVIEAAKVAVGAAGDAITVAMIGDSPAAGGVSIVVSPTAQAVVIHFEDGVSTVGTVETAIGALAGANAIIRVKTSGTGATVLHSPADDFTATHLAGGISFRIAVAASELALQTNRANVQFEFGAGDQFLTTAARGATLPVANAVQGPYTTGNLGPVISVYNPGVSAAEVLVYAA